jgi:hypothetical protein
MCSGWRHIARPAKAAEGRRTPRRFAFAWARRIRGSVLERASPLALFFADQNVPE